MSKIRQCVFCGENSLSNEHIFAKWLLKELGIYDKDVAMTHASAMGVPLSNRKHSFSKLVNGLVCEKCNNGWMSQLEGDCQESIINLMNLDKIGIDFLCDNYYNIAKWAFKNAILLNSATNYRQLVPTSHYNNLYNGELPPNTFVDLAFCDNDNDLIIEWRQSPGSLMIKDKSIPINPNAEKYIIIFKIKSLMIKVAYFESDYNVFYEDEGSIRLHPQFGTCGELKNFDNIDSFDINGKFHEYL